MATGQTPYKKNMFVVRFSFVRLDAHHQRRGVAALRRLPSRPGFGGRASGARLISGGRESGNLNPYLEGISFKDKDLLAGEVIRFSVKAQFQQAGEAAGGAAAAAVVKRGD
jgi:hypothetical protein